MGQVALGFRSLLIKLAVFFVMAVLLAWALGGTLWPRAEVVDLEVTAFQGRDWFWRLTAGGRTNTMRWTIMSRGAEGEEEPVDDRVWSRVIPIVETPDAIFYAASAGFGADAVWQIERIGADGLRSSHRVPDGLAAERQIARIAAGLNLQDAPTIEALRPHVLDPPPGPAVGGAGPGRTAASGD